MRNKREENNSTKEPLESAVDKKRAVVGGGRSTTRRNQENGGEALVRFIITPDEESATSFNGYMKNPFSVVKEIARDTDDTLKVADFTKFHLEDNEMLMELMIHLHADCPDLMNDKADLIERVSKLYDQIQKT
jgi:hypothetical protein